MDTDKRGVNAEKQKESEEDPGTTSSELAATEPMPDISDEGPNDPNEVVVEQQQQQQQQQQQFRPDGMTHRVLAALLSLPDLKLSRIKVYIAQFRLLSLEERQSTGEEV